jgi:hypothetical protein
MSKTDAFLRIGKREAQGRFANRPYVTLLITGLNLWRGLSNDVLWPTGRIQLHRFQMRQQQVNDA